MSAWVWIAREATLAIHDMQLSEHGGLEGVRDTGLLDSALARPQHLAGHGTPDAAALAVAYGRDIASRHPFIDGNKRTGYVAAELFLLLNGHVLTVSDESAVLTTLSLAAGDIDESAFADWLRRHLQPR